MSKILELEEKISELRRSMYEMIIKNEELTDSQTVTVSQMLDTLLNEYENLIKKKP